MWVGWCDNEKTPRSGIRFSSPRLDLSGAKPPLGLLQHASQSSCVQVTVSSRPRSRRCLLKWCECLFRPAHRLSRYCNEVCQQAARRWSQWRAAQRYRKSEQGKETRRRQSCRYRERVKAREEQAESGTPESCEGHHQQADSEKFSCSRPGCYELYSSEARSPLKRFCSLLCRRALGRVRKREARWRRRLLSGHSREAG